MINVKSVVVEQSRAIPVQSGCVQCTLASAAGDLFALVRLIHQSKEVRDQTGAQDSVGQARVITMRSAKQARARADQCRPAAVVRLRSPASRPLAPLVALVEGKWASLRGYRNHSDRSLDHPS